MAEVRREQVNSQFGNNVDIRQGSGLNAPVSVGGVGGAAPIQVEMPSTQVLNDLAAWGGKMIRDKAAKEYNKQYVDGQMQHQQGVAMDKVSGGPWAKEGYRVMEAQTIASTFLAAQQAEIENSAYSMTPDEYRAQYMQRVDSALEGKDPRTQELVREEIMRQMPTLAASQVGANAQYTQQRTYEAGVTAIDTLSKDPTAVDRLLAIAEGGPTSPIAGLGENEQRAVITDGVIAAFNNDNPQAYKTLQENGLLDNLSADQLTQIKNAENAYKGRKKNEWDADRAKEQDALDKQVAAGELTPLDAAKKQKELNDKYGLDTTMGEGQAAMGAAEQGQRVKGETTRNNINIDIANGNYTEAARKAAPAVAQKESGGNYNAQGPVVKSGRYKGDRAYGKYQVMGLNVPEWTKKYYGTRLTPQEFLKNHDAQEAVFNGHFGSLMAKYGTVEDAVSAWHSGGSLKEARARNANDSYITTEQYVNDIMGNMGVQPPTPEMQYQQSVNTLQAEQEERYAARWAEFSNERMAVDSNYVNGNTTQQQWQQEREALYGKYTIARDVQMVNDEVSVTAEAMKLKQTNAKLANDAAAEQAAAQAQIELDMLQAGVQNVINDPNSTPQQQQNALMAYKNDRDAILKKYNVTDPTARGDAEFGNQMRDWIVKAEDANRVATEKQATLMRAYNNGTVGTDPNVDGKTAEKWFNGVVANAQQTAKNMMAKDPSMTQQQADDVVQQMVVEEMSKSGYVPPSMKARYSAVLSSNMLDKNGNPTPQAVSAVEDYMTMKMLNPRVADMMVDATAKANAEAIMDMAGGDASNIPYMIQARDGTSLLPGAKSPAEFMADPAVQEAVDDSMSRFMQEDFWSWVTPWNWNPAITERSGDPTFRAAMLQEVNQQVLRMYSRTGGKGSPDNLVKAAFEEINNRSAILGGIPFVAQGGVDLYAKTFGAGLSSYGGPANFKQEMQSDPASVDNAVRLFIANNAGKPGYGIPEMSTKLDREVTSGFLDSIGDVGPNVAAFLTEGFVEAAGGPYIESSMNQINYDPMYVTPDGKHLRVSIDMPDGSLPVQVMIPLQQAGTEYIKFKQTR